MKRLDEILANEKSLNTITKFAEELGFRSDNIMLIITKFPEHDSLRLLVEVEDDAVGNVNYTYLLAAKLIQYFDINVVVISREELSETSMKEIQNCSFSLLNSESQITAFRKCTLDNITFIAPDVGKLILDRALESADMAISRIQKLKADKIKFSISGELKEFTAETPAEELPSVGESSSTANTKDMKDMSELLDSANKKILEETLMSLPGPIVDSIFSIFAQKRRQHAGEEVLEDKKQRMVRSESQFVADSSGKPNITVG